MKHHPNVCLSLVYFLQTGTQIHTTIPPYHPFSIFWYTLSVPDPNLSQLKTAWDSKHPHLHYCIYQTSFQQLVHTTARFGGLSTGPLLLDPKSTLKSSHVLTATSPTVTASSHGNAGEVLSALITNCVKLTPKWTSFLPFASQKRKWIYTSRDTDSHSYFYYINGLFVFL